VHTTYFTTVVDDDGNVQYFADIYGLDGRVASALEGQPVSFTARGGTPVNPHGKTAQTGVRTKSRAPQNTTAPSSFNPFAANFGN
jgi:hypothetical protein